MVSKTLFPSKRSEKVVKSIPVANTRNLAGGKAYDTGAEHSLCQYVATGTLNGTFYASEDQHLKTVQALVDKVSPELIAKAAVYGAETAKMKDMPAFLLAVLAARGEIDLLRRAFPRVIKNMKMLCNFVQIIRSGTLGRKSFGTAVKKLIQKFLKSRKPSDLFAQHFGHASPSVADIIKMVRPRPEGPVESAIYSYLIGKNVDFDNLPFNAQQFELFKKGKTSEVPNLDYRALSNCNLTKDNWKTIAENMPWNNLRLNLNKLAKEGVFDDKKLTKTLVERIRDPELVKKFNVFPYQLMTTVQNIDGVPTPIINALQDALDISTSNVPDLGDVAVLVDTSGSMSHAITGNRGSVTSKTSCVQVACMIASCIARNSSNPTIVRFDTIASEVKMNTRDSVLTNAGSIPNTGGGTDIACGLHFIRKKGCKAKTVIIISDNESWFQGTGGYYGRGTQAAAEWAKYCGDVKGAKLICIDLTPNKTVQVPDSKNVLNIGGFSDAVFDVIANFVEGDSDHFVNVIKKVDL